jgi:tagatose 1,6-diphosphate aldolase
VREAVQDIEFNPPPPLRCEGVTLHWEEAVPADHVRGLVPYYVFGMRLDSGVRVGHISFRIGDTREIHRFAGHIGYGVLEEFRGNGFAGKACLAIRPFVAEFYDAVIITCNPDNWPSVRTIEKIGGEFIECVEIPEGHFLRRERGLTAKNRYRWVVRYDT